MQSAKNKLKIDPAIAELRQTEAAKTSRLRAMRLAKEAEDRQAAVDAKMAEKSRKPARRASSLGAAS